MKGNKAMKTSKMISNIYQHRRELSPEELDCVVAGKKPKQGAALFDFFMWIACGFNHHYVPTGKTRTEIDLVFEVPFYEVKCLDCGHMTWKRGECPNIQGPRISPDVQIVPQS